MCQLRRSGVTKLDNVVVRGCDELGRCTVWIYASSVASTFHRDLADLLDELRVRGVTEPPALLERAAEWGDVDYTFGGSISVTPAPAPAGEGRQPVMVRPHVWFATHPLVPGHETQRRLDPNFHGTDDVTWLLCQRMGGRDLAVGEKGPEFFVDLAPSREAQEAAAPTVEDLGAMQEQRCQCAPANDDDRQCEGPRDLIRVRDGDTVLQGCYGHAIDVLRRDSSVHAEPGTTLGYTTAALEAAAHGVSELGGPRRRDTARERQSEPACGSRGLPDPSARGNGRATSPWWRRLLRLSPPR